MYTSYYEGFVKIQPFINNIGISIAGRPDPCFKGPEFTELRAELFFLNQYKLDRDESAYRENYYKYVLSKFTPEGLYNELCQKFGQNAVLLCYEKPEEFCHRRIVAEYLERALGIRVPELDIETIEIKAKENKLYLNKELPTLML